MPTQLPSSPSTVVPEPIPTAAAPADTDTRPHVVNVTTAGFMTDVVERSKLQPVLVDFWASWCAPCRALGPVLERLATEFAGGFVLAKVDTEAEPALSSQFQIRSIPTVILFAAGKVVTAFQGALPEGQIRDFLAKHGVERGGANAFVLSDDPIERVLQLRTALAAQPGRESLKLDLAVALLASGQTEEAAQALEALPSPAYADPRAVKARARVALLHRLATAEAARTAHAVPIRAILDGDAAAGVTQLIELLREERQDEHSPARGALVDAFGMINDDDVVRDGRRAMARVLF